MLGGYEDICSMFEYGGGERGGEGNLGDLSLNCYLYFYRKFLV